MTTEFEAELARAFLRWDVDRNGRIDRLEFQGLVEELAPERGADASAAFEQMDYDDNRSISYDEFLGWWYGRPWPASSSSADEDHGE